MEIGVLLFFTDGQSPSLQVVLFLAGLGLHTSYLVLQLHSLFKSCPQLSCFESVPHMSHSEVRQMWSDSLEIPSLGLPLIRFPHTVSASGLLTSFFCFSDRKDCGMSLCTPAAVSAIWTVLCPRLKAPEYISYLWLPVFQVHMHSPLVLQLLFVFCPEFQLYLQWERVSPHIQQDLTPSYPELPHQRSYFDSSLFKWG